MNVNRNITKIDDQFYLISYLLSTFHKYTTRTRDACNIRMALNISSKPLLPKT